MNSLWKLKVDVFYVVLCFPWLVGAIVGGMGAIGGCVGAIGGSGGVVCFGFSSFNEFFMET